MGRKLHGQFGQQGWVEAFDRDLAACHALEDQNHAAFFWLAQRNRFATSPGAASTAHAVDIGFSIAGHVEVDDMADSTDIDTASGNVGGNQNPDASTLEISQGLHAGRLPFVAMDCARGHTRAGQNSGHAVGTVQVSDDQERWDAGTAG